MGSLALFFFAALSLNLLLGFAIGVREPLRQTPQHYYPWIILFVSALFAWILFARILEFSGGVLDYLLLLPFSVLGSMALERLFFRFVLKNKTPEKNSLLFAPGTSYTEQAAAVSLLTLRFAFSFADAVLLSLAFSAGGLLAFLIIKEIQKRSSMETIPYSLRGTPVSLISMGLLSLIFTAASVLLIKNFF